jgi:hypothetical protein
MPPPSAKVTYIDDLPELENFFDNKQQSMQGFPPRINPNFSKQFADEMDERDRTMKPLQGKIRQSNDFRTAANGGNEYERTVETVNFYQEPNFSHLPPYPPQLSHQPPPPPRPPPRPSHQIPQDYLLIEPIEPMDYKLGPRARQEMAQHRDDHRERHGHHHGELSCIEIAKHIKDCPICSKFYDTDKSLYIIIIIILIIFCILLLKKCLFENHR